MTSKIAAATLILTLAAFPAVAESESARMTVSATVIARAIIAIDSRPEVIVTDSDVRQGYVDVAEPLQLRVRSNSRRGYLLQVAKTNDSFSAVELSFGNSRMVVAQEGWIARPAVSGGETVSAKMRVRLIPGTTAGRHPLPVEVSVQPL